MALQFQSTSPVRGTTPILKDGDLTLVISIHVPREGDDDMAKYGCEDKRVFQSTSPVRGTT